MTLRVQDKSSCLKYEDPKGSVFATGKRTTIAVCPCIDDPKEFEKKTNEIFRAKLKELPWHWWSGYGQENTDKAMKEAREEACHQNEN